MTSSGTQVYMQNTYIKYNKILKNRCWVQIPTNRDSSFSSYTKSALSMHFVEPWELIILLHRLCVLHCTGSARHPELCEVWHPPCYHAALLIKVLHLGSNLLHILHWWPRCEAPAGRWRLQYTRPPTWSRSSGRHHGSHPELIKADPSPHSNSTEPKRFKVGWLKLKRCCVVVQTSWPATLMEAISRYIG